MSRIRRLSQVISEEGRRALASQQAAKIRDAAFAIVDQANLNASTTRKVTKKAAFTVVLRSLQSTRNLPFSLREHMALKELSQYITLAQSDKSNSLTLANTDLLPVAHPRSTRNHSMTASALSEARARWITDDPRITDEQAKAVVASALTSDYGSVEHTYYNSMLAAFPQGVIPADVIIAAGDPFSGGNSSAERSLRARLQRRDREGKFAFMGGGMSALIRRKNGKVYNLVGRPIVDGPDGDDVQVQLPDGKIVNIPASKGMFVKAVINPTPDGFSQAPAKTATTSNIINESDLVYVDAPNGWKKVGTNAWESNDGKHVVAKSKDDNGFDKYEVKDARNGDVVTDSAGDWEDALDAIADRDEKKASIPSKPEQPEEALVKPPLEDAKKVKKTEYTKEVIPYDTTTWDEESQKAVKSSGEAEIIDYAGRKIVVVDVNGEKVPFYLSSGQGGKKDVEAGKWYPFFGVGEDGWINKLSAEEINNYYDSPELKAAAEWLDANVGDVRDDKSIPKVGASGKHLDFINQGLNPAENEKPSTPELVNKNIADVKERVSLKEKQADLPSEPKKATAPSKFEFKYPEGAKKLNKDTSYDPEGRVDEASTNYSDDPAEIAQRYDTDDIVRELERGILPEEEGDNATGYGVLPFNRGDEYVPAEALYLALVEQGEDAEMELAKIYDKALGGSDNVDALNDSRKKVATLDQAKPDVAESFERTVAMSPDEPAPAEEPKFDAQEMDQVPLPPLLEGLSDAEMNIFMETKDHTPYLPENEDIEMPEGYNTLNPEPFQSWREVTADTPDAVLPEGFSDNPVFVSQSVPKDKLETELRRSLEPNSETPGYANISLQDEDGEEFIANVPGEAVRDALQLQGVDTNELIKSIAEEGFAGQKAELEQPEKPVDEIKAHRDELKRRADERIDELDRSVPEGWGIAEKVKETRLPFYKKEHFSNAYGLNNFEASVDADGKITVKDRNGLLPDKSYDTWDDVQADLSTQQAEYATAARAEVKKIAEAYGYSAEQIAALDSMSQQEIADFFINPENQTEKHKDVLDDLANAWAVDRPNNIQKERWARAKRNDNILAQAGDMPTAEEDYRMRHRPADEESGASLDDVRGNDIYPENVYSPEGVKLYSTGYPELDKEVHSLILKAKSNPDMPITIYRAVPKDAPTDEIQPGDWVTLTEGYAKVHGESNLNDDYKILSAEVKAKDIRTSGDSWHEWGYNPAPSVPTSTSKTQPITEEPAMPEQIAGQPPRFDGLLWDTRGPGRDPEKSIDIRGDAIQVGDRVLHRGKYKTVKEITGKGLNRTVHFEEEFPGENSWLTVGIKMQSIKRPLSKEESAPNRTISAPKVQPITETPQDFAVDSVEEIPDGLEENPKPADVAVQDVVNPSNPLPPQRIVVKAVDLQPGDITVGDHFVIEAIGEKVPGTTRVKIIGHYPGHVSQDTKQWNEFREIEVIRGVEAPAAGDLPVLSKPKEQDFGRRKKDKETGQWGFANPEDQAAFDAARAEYDVQLDAAKKRFTDPTEPSNQPHRAIVRAGDLKPGDVSADPKRGHFVIERTFVDEKTKPGFISVEGYYPGHGTQRKEWKVDGPIDVIRNVEPPAKGDLEPIHQPNKTINGKWVPDKDPEKRAAHEKEIADAAALWQAPENLPVIDIKNGNPENEKDIPQAVAIPKPGQPMAPTMPVFQGEFAQIARDAGGDWNKFRELLAGREIVVFDFETTGFKPEDGNEPWQVGGVKMKDGKIIDRFVIYMNPGRSIADTHAGKLGEDGQPNAVDSDGNPLTDEYLAKQLTQEEAMRQFLEWMGPDALVVAQNMAFDDEVMRRTADKHGLDYAPAGMMDTLPMARGIFKDVPEEDKPKNISGKYIGKPGYSLEALANHFGIKLDNWHSADADSEATAQILEKLIDKGIELDAGKDFFDVDARNDEYIKKLDDYNKKLDLYEHQLQDWAAAKAIQNANEGKPVNLDEMIAVSKAGGAPDPEGLNMGRVGAEQEVPAAPELDPAIIDFTANTMYPKGKMRLMERDWILDDANTTLLPRDDIRMRDLLPGDFMQSKDGNTIWQVVAVRGGEEFGLQPGRVKVYRRNVETNEVSTYEHWHTTRLDGVRRAINPEDLNIPEGSNETAINNPVESIPEGVSADTAPTHIDVDVPQAQAAPAAAKVTVTQDGEIFHMEAIVYGPDGEEVYRAEGSYRTRAGAQAEGEALIQEFAKGNVAQQRDEQGDIPEARATDVPVSRGEIPAGAENAPEQIEVENLPSDVSGKIQITSVYGKEPKFEAEAVVQDRDGDLVANQTSEHTTKKAAEKEGRDFIARVLDALMNPEPAEEPSEPKKPKKTKELSEGEKAVIKNNAYVEENAGSLQPIRAEDVQVGDFIWNAFFGRYEEVQSNVYAGTMNRMKMEVFNVYNGKVETRYFEMDSPLRNVRRPGVQDEAEPIPSAKAAPRGGKRNVIKRKPVSERIVAKEGRKMGGDFGREGFFQDKNGVPLKPGDVVMHKDPVKGAKWKRGVVKKREGAQVEEGKKAGAVGRKGVAYLDYLYVQWEGEDVEAALNQGGRLVKAKNLIKHDGSTDGMVMPEFRGGNVRPNPKEAAPKEAKQDKLFESSDAKPPVANPEMPKQIYKTEMTDKAGRRITVSVVKLGDRKYEAAAFSENKKVNAVISTGDSLGGVLIDIQRFTEAVVDASNGEDIIRLYGGIPDTNVNAEPLPLEAETVVVPELPKVKSIDLKIAKLKAKNLKERVLDKAIPGEDVLPGISNGMQERIKNAIQNALSPDGIDRRQNNKFDEEMAIAQRYAVRLGWFDEAREIAALRVRNNTLPLRPMDDEFNANVEALRDVHALLTNNELEFAAQVSWQGRERISQLMDAVNNALIYPDIYNHNFRNAISGARRSLDALIEEVDKNPDKKQEVVDKLDEIKKYLDSFGELPKLPARKVEGSDKQNQRMAEIAREFEGLSIDDLKNGHGNWKFEKPLSAGINRVYLLKNSLTGERVVVKFDRDSGEKVNGVFAGNGIKAEEMVASLYKDLGFAQPAFKAVNPDNTNVEVGGVGVMEYAGDGFFGLVGVNVHHALNVYTIDQVAPQHRAELLDFVVANAIIGNSDRHGGNFMWGRDPVSGDVRIIPIDNGLALFNGAFGKPERHLNDPLYLNPIHILIGGPRGAREWGNKNQVGKFASQWIKQIGEEEAKNQIVEFAQRMRDRAEAMEFVDERANAYIIARAEYIMKNAQKLVDLLNSRW